MKKISLKDFKNTLNRDEMRDIRGGDADADYNIGDINGNCASDCEPGPIGDRKCKTADCPNSYCSQQTCVVSGNLNVRKNSCQYQ